MKPLPDSTCCTRCSWTDRGDPRDPGDDHVREAERVWAALADVGVDTDAVAEQLESEGVDSFRKSFDELIDALQTKAAELSD